MYDRVATDVPIGICFVICVIIWVVIVAYAISKGNVQKILAGVDGLHNVCGDG